MTDPWRQVKHDTYLAFYLSAMQVYELRVWSEHREDRPAATAGLSTELAGLAHRLAFSAPAPLAAAAASVRTAADVFIAVLDDMRINTLRQPHGHLDEPHQQRYDNAQREFGASIDQFATLARTDLGITGDYLPLAPTQDG